MPPFNYIFQKLSLPKYQTLNGSVNYICMLKGIPDRIYMLKVRQEYQANLELFMYSKIMDDLRTISGIIEIIQCLMFTDKCLIVQEYPCATLADFIQVQNSGNLILRESVIGIIVLDLMKILRCLQKNFIIHGCFKSDNIFIANRLLNFLIKNKLNFVMLKGEAALLVKLGNWDFANESSDSKEYHENINKNEIVIKSEYDNDQWNHERDTKDFISIVHELCDQPLENFYMHQLWLKLFDLELPSEHEWNTLIDELAEAVDIHINTNRGIPWITAQAEYNAIFDDLLQTNLEMRL
ncbi:unnamed protein product [Thelazia callipaeda]|uniref:Protein kinase domain-containing protein n=1 Tax=Thelazia callipaeda TaxID=103827 RepID=A0A0N5CQV0_THECL|nr:unnamed protein product [Thelazia callipaeda]